LAVDAIADDEVLLRHIPGGTLWQAPGPRITSANFQLRHDRNETGVSVTRLHITAPQRLLELVGGSPEQGSRVASVRAGDVRALGLRVVPKPLPDGWQRHKLIPVRHAFRGYHGISQSSSRRPGMF
jgi:hypothetical protein